MRWTNIEKNVTEAVKYKDISYILRHSVAYGEVKYQKNNLYK